MKRLWISLLVLLFSFSALEKPLPQITVEKVLDIPYAGLISKYAKKYNLDERLVGAICKVESNFNAGAVSEKGAMGIMQIHQSMFSFLHLKNPFDVEENLNAGCWWLSYLVQKYGTDMAVRCYYAGETLQKSKRFIRLTEKYKRKVVTAYFSLAVKWSVRIENDQTQDI